MQVLSRIAATYERIEQLSYALETKLYIVTTDFDDRFATEIYGICDVISGLRLRWIWPYTRL